MNFCIINIFYLLDGKKKKENEDRQTKKAQIWNTGNFPKIIKELRFRPRLSGSRVQPINHYTDCHPQQTTLKMCWLIRNEQNESCEWSFVWASMRTAAWEIAPQIALRDCSKEGGRKDSVYVTLVRGEYMESQQMKEILQVMGVPDHLTVIMEKPVCRSRSNSSNWTWNNRLVPNRERSISRLYVVTLLI